MAHRQEAVEIQPQFVGQVWHKVLPGIKALLRKCPDDFTEYDVYWYLRESKASLFLLGDGFMVLEVATEPFTQKRTLCVWLLYWLQAEENQELIYQTLDALAVRAQCSRIHFKSPRLGWMKKARGFKQKLITWERV